MWLLMLFLGNLGLGMSYWGTLPLGIVVSLLIGEYSTAAVALTARIELPSGPLETTTGGPEALPRTARARRTALRARRIWLRVSAIKTGLLRMGKRRPPCRRRV